MREPASMAVRAAVRDALADVPDGATVLAGVSGGADSLALAAALAWVAERRPITAGAIIIDHQLQPTSAEVAADAADVCRALALAPVEIVRVVVADPARLGPEAAAREARHTALGEAATRFGASAILLGHTRDDNAEQVLLGLARGSGLRSLTGIPPLRGLLRRPLLRITRAQTEASCAELGLTPWRDPHNDDPTFARVRARRALADLEADLGPGFADALARTATQLRADADLLDDLAAQAAAQLGDGPWPVDRLAAIPTALRTRVWRRLLIAAGAPAGQVSARHTDACDRLVTHWRGQGPLDLPGVTVTRAAGRVRVQGNGSARHTVN